MKKSIWSRIGDFLLGKGFYMVLLLCVMAIGGSGYYLYHLASTGLAEEDQAVSAPAQVEVETEPAVSDQEVNQELADALAQAEAEAQAQAAAVAEAQAQQEAQAAAKAAQEAAPETTQTETKPATEEASKPEEATTEEAATEEAAAEETPAAQETVEPVTEEAPAQTTFAPPVGGETVAAFSDSELTYNAALEDWRTHNGVDLAAQVGDPVSAVLDGEVLEVTNDLLLGTTITLNHGDGLMTVYGNLDEDVTVEQGDTVTAGETLGSVGNTAAGEAHEGAWLHFAVEQDGVAVDPADYLE